MKLLRILAIVCLILSAVPMRAQDEKPKKQAKDLYEKAMKETGDHAGQVRDLCQAAQLQPKEKKYSDACATYRTNLIHDDDSALAGAQSAFQANDLEKAESLARQVSGADPRLAGQAKTVLDNIRNEKLSQQGVAEVKAAWERGEFNIVMALAQTMTTPATKASAALYVKDVSLYNEYIEAANKAQNSNPQEAINQLGYAYGLNPHGPVDAKARIAELQAAISAKANAKSFQNQTAGAKTGTGTTLNPDTVKQLNKLLVDARNAEKQGNAAAALSDYQSILKLQPGNQEALTKSTTLAQAIKSDPKAAAANELRSAIRSFYQAQYDDARTALMDYLESPQTAQNPGAADFYLGATLIERSILRTARTQWKGPSQDAITAFKEARKANYAPVRAYVSPVLLKIWDSTAQ